MKSTISHFHWDDKKEIVRCRALQISGTKQLKPFFEKHISKEAKVRTDKWRGYGPLKKEYEELKQEESNPNKILNYFIAS